MQGIEPGALYDKAMSTLGLGAALWYPEDRVEIGDVGYFSNGSFIRMFNVMLPPSESEGVLPEEYEALEGRGGSVKSTVKPMVKMSKNISLKSPSLSEFTSEPTPLTFPKRFHFVTSGGPAALLITLENAIAEEIRVNSEFETHFTNNYRLWIDAARENFSQILHEEDLVLVRGHTKISSRWILVALNGSGSFTMEVDELNGVSLTSDKRFPYFIRQGSVSAAKTAREIHERDLADGYVSQPFIEEDLCLFIKYYTMKKRVWGSPKVVSIP